MVEEFGTDTQATADAALHVSPRSDGTAAVAVVTLDNHDIRARHFLDDSVTFSYLESVLLQLRPSKPVLCNALHEQWSLKKGLLRVVDKCEVQLDFLPPAGFATKTLTCVELEKLLQPDDGKSVAEAQRLYTSSETDNKQMVAKALTMLLSKKGILGNMSFLRRLTLDILPINRFVRLDRASFSVLHILPTRGENCRSGTSLMGFLNRCRTKVGQSTLLRWLCQPSTDADEIIMRHDVVQLLLKHSQNRYTLQQRYLGRLPAFAPLEQRFFAASCTDEGRVLDVCELDVVLRMYRAYLDLNALAGCIDAFLAAAVSSAADPSWTPSDAEVPSEQCIVSFEKLIREPLTKHLRRLKKFGDLCEYAFDSRAMQEGRAEISKNLLPHLSKVYAERDALMEEVELHRNEVEDELGLKSGAIRTFTGTKPHSLYYRVTKRDQRVCQENKTLCKQIKINKADYQFTTARLNAIVESLDAVNIAIEEKQQVLASKTVVAAASYWSVLKDVGDLVGLLDVLCSFAEVAASSPTAPFVRPKILQPADASNTDGYVEDGARVLRLTESRHPLLERQLASGHVGKSRDFVPNSIDLSSVENRHMYLITGANMGGKSTVIRQAALCIFMAQIGSYVPCKKAEMTVFDAVLCRIGASDDPLRGASTFFMEMVETASILRSVTSKSFVLIDELGRGTSTHEGFGLAWEIAAFLAEKKRCLGLIATHFHELAALENHSKGGILNYQLRSLVDRDNIQFLYKLERGPATASYGLEVAKIAGLDSEILAKAESILRQLEAKGAASLAPPQSTEPLLVGF